MYAKCTMVKCKCSWDDDELRHLHESMFSCRSNDPRAFIACRIAKGIGEDKLRHLTHFWGAGAFLVRLLIGAALGKTDEAITAIWNG